MARSARTQTSSLSRRPPRSVFSSRLRSARSGVSASRARNHAIGPSGMGSRVVDHAGSTSRSSAGSAAAVELDAPSSAALVIAQPGARWYVGGTLSPKGRGFSGSASRSSASQASVGTPVPAAWPDVARSSASPSTAFLRSWKNAQTSTIVWVAAAIATLHGADRSLPIPSQSEICGLFG